MLIKWLIIYKTPKGETVNVIHKEDKSIINIYADYQTMFCIGMVLGLYVRDKGARDVSIETFDSFQE